MTTISVPADLGRSDAQHEPLRYTVEIADSLTTAEPIWRQLESDAVMSPYGRFDWISALAAGEPRVRVAILRDAAGRPALLLPVAIHRRHGLVIGAGIGGKHANFNLPVLRPDVMASLDPRSARSLLRDAGRQLGLDAFAFVNVPISWEGQPNPFAPGGTTSPSDAWGLALEPDGEATLKRSMSGDARKKLRNKSRGLAKLGAVEVRQARTAAEVDGVLAAFLRQKEDRFRELGIADPFAEPAMQAILRAGALAGLDGGHPAIELYGLMVADRVVAVLGGAADATRLSGMFVSFEAGEAARFSPGEILSTEVVRLQCARGRLSFDLGVGEARYKRSFCDRVEPLVDLVVPVTAAGRVYGLSRALLVDLKRRVKASPRAMKAVDAVRRRMAPLL